MTSLPITCVHTIVNASHCVGFTFPGIIDDPGSFAGSIISPIPDLGPEPSQRISFAILNKELAITFSAPDNSIILSCPPRASNLLSAVRKFKLVNFLISFAISIS